MTSRVGYHRLPGDEEEEKKTAASKPNQANLQGRVLKQGSVAATSDSTRLLAITKNGYASLQDCDAAAAASNPLLRSQISSAAAPYQQSGINVHVQKDAKAQPGLTPTPPATCPFPQSGAAPRAPQYVPPVSNKPKTITDEDAKKIMAEIAACINHDLLRECMDLQYEEEANELLLKQKNLERAEFYFFQIAELRVRFRLLVSLPQNHPFKERPEIQKWLKENDSEILIEN
jgi:hypothetical protein